MLSEVGDWIRLTTIPGTGNVSARKLLLAFGLPDQIFSADFQQLCNVVGHKQAQSICAKPAPGLARLIARTEQWLTTPGNFMLSLADSDYPAALLNIPDPPILLYGKGIRSLLNQCAIAMVGSRSASTQGKHDAKRFAGELSQAGLTVISGLASGIDAAAHQGGLTATGSTVAVIGTGIDIVYPASNQRLARQIACEGCVVSEYPLGTPALPGNFPKRNRIISGLARGVLVIEAAARSGSLITARMALDQGKDVFALPGSIHSPLSKGCHLLIRQGATLVEAAKDILEDWGWNFATPSQTPAHDEDRLPSLVHGAISPASDHPVSIDHDLLTCSVLDHLGFDPVHPDQLADSADIDSGSLAAQLTILELAGKVERLADGRVRRLG